MIDLVELKAEVTTDPDTVGYTGDDAGDADLLNAIPSPGASAPYTVNDPHADSADIRAALGPNDLSSLSAAQQDLLRFYVGAERTANTQQVRDFIGSVFSGAVLVRLQKLVQREGSRAEFLWAAGDTVTPSQVADARRL